MFTLDQNRRWLAVAFSVLFVVLSCESVTEDEVEEEATVLSSTVGSVTGYLFNNGGLEFVDAPGNASPGATPVAGGEVRALGIVNSSERSITTGSDGSFIVEDLKPGLYKLEGRTAPGDPDPGVVGHASIIADVYIAVGKPFAVSRDEAFQALAANGSNVSRTGAQLEIDDATLVLGTVQPLPAGVKVRVVSHGAAHPLIRETEADEWFFLIDFFPEAAFGHEV